MFKFNNFKNVVIVHDTDNDGNCAAWIALRFFRDFAKEVLSQSYNVMTVPLRAGNNTLPEKSTPHCKKSVSYVIPKDKETTFVIVDRSLPTQTISELLDVGCGVIVLDHHVTNYRDAEPLLREHPFDEAYVSKKHSRKDVVTFHEVEKERFLYIYNSELSGCGIASDFFSELSEGRLYPNSFNGKQMYFESSPIITPYFVDYIQDRDLWKHTLIHTKAINAYINSFDTSIIDMFNFFDRECHIHNPSDVTSDRRNRIEIGTGILQEKLRIYSKIIRSKCIQWTRLKMFGNSPVAILNNVPLEFISDIADLIFKKECGTPYDVDVVMAVSEIYEQEELTSQPPSPSNSHHTESRISMRSKPHIDISGVAVMFGGGGHPNACGFTVKSNELIPIDGDKKVEYINDTEYFDALYTKAST